MGPRLIGAYGLAFIWAGIFLADPADGYPVGSPAGTPAQQSWHGLLHLAAPTLTGFALDAACLVFARRFYRRGERGWTAYCLATVAADLATAAAAARYADFRWLLPGGACTWICASLITGQLITEHAGANRAP